MYHFFVNKEQVEEGQIRVIGGDYNHMKHVLRMKVGEPVSVNDGSGFTYQCVIKEYDSDGAVLSVKERWEGSQELSSKLCLYQGLPKGDKMELIIQKAVELGAFSVNPVKTSRTVVKLDDAKAKKKLLRWNAISESAAKQSKRDRIPEVREILTFSQALEEMAAMDIALIPYEHAEGITETRKILTQIQPGQSVAILIGPEGGFSEEEVSQALEKGVLPLTLGRRILRTETAGMALLSVLMMQLEE